MVRRDEFLRLVENCTETELCQFAKECREQDGGDGGFQEIFDSCSKKQLDHAWQKIYNAVSTSLIGFEGTENQADDEQIAQGTIKGSRKVGLQKKWENSFKEWTGMVFACISWATENTTRRKGIVQTNSSLQSTLEVISCLVGMVTAMTNQKEVYIPDSLFQTKVLLQGVLPRLPQAEDKIKNSIACLFEDWWKKKLQQRDDLIITTMVYLVERSLDLEPKPLIADVKRVWSLHDVLPLIDLQNESSTDFKEMLRRCFISSQYLQQVEGLRFLGYVLSLDESFTDDLHRTIKKHLLSVPRSWHEGYGEIYFRAWQLTSGAKQQKLEQACIQDLMYHAVHAHHSLLPALKKLLGYIHRQKKQRGVDEMLCRLYEPIIWRSLRVANSDVRYNAAVLFFDVFPLQNHELNVQESDQLLQKQFDLFRELLYDPFPNIRSLSVLSVLKVMTEYWEVIPSETLKNLIVTIIQDLLVDANSSDVRQKVIKGLTRLLDNPLSHLFLKPILPEVRNAFHDVSEKVRLSVLELLAKVKTLRTIKYWNIVPIEHLLARLVIDSDPVNRRIVKLIFPSFVPLESSGEVQLENCIALIKSNPAAARQMFKYASQTMSIDDTVSYITLLCKALLMAIKTSNENGAESDTEQSGDEATADSSDEELKLSNTPVMLGLVEIILILWTMSEGTLKKASNSHHKKNLEKKFSYALPEMLHSFSDPQIVSVLIQIAGHLPANYIPAVSRAWVPKLRNMTSENTEDDYSVIITSVCEVGRAADILELVYEWLTSSLVTEASATPSATKVSKKAKKVGFVEERQPQPQLGLDFLSFMFRHHLTREIVLRDNLKECVNMRDLLRNCQSCIENFTTGYGNGDASFNEKFLQEGFIVFCKINVLLHSVDNKNYNCLEEFLPLLSWADKHILPVLSVKEETDSDARKRPVQTGGHLLAKQVIQNLLNTFNNMLLVGIGDTRTCTQLVDFCTACLAADEKLCLLSDVMLCLYQVTEFLKFSQPNSEDIVDSSLGSGTIPNALSRILVSIASHVKQNPDSSAKLLSSVKGHVVELLKSVFATQSPDDSMLPDVMATIFATILAELSFFSSQYDLEEDCSPTLLPPVSSWLLDTVQTRPDILRFFVQEVSHFVDSEDIVGLHNIHGAVHLLGALTKCKHKIDGLKDLWSVVDKKTDKQLKEQTEEDAETNKELVTAIETKLKEIQIT